jgi:hypothetical protein
VTDRIGATLDRGRIAVVGGPADGLWRGTQRGGRDVVIAFKAIGYAKARAETDALFRYDVPGLAKLAFLGYPDGGPDPTAEELRELNRRNVWPEVALAEERPDGVTLAAASALDERAAIRLGIDLCEVAIAWSERCEQLTTGLRPETVYVHDDSRRYTGATPRVELLLGREADPFEAPAAGGLSYTADDLGFQAGRLIWFALLREDPYRFPGAMNSLDNVWTDRRRAWTGPPALGAVLDQVLRADGRLPVRELRDALLRL